MIKKLLALSLIMISFCVGAQEVKLPGYDFTSEKYANISKFSLDKHLPTYELKELGSIRDESMEAMTADMLDFAKTFMGTRYVRGGKGPKGFDCSGFTSYVYRQFGFEISPSSKTQYTQGAKVNRDEIRPGDLLFFAGRGGNTKIVGHVGIAISSDSETGVVTFIHASCNRGISIEKTSTPYYSKRYIGARRIIED